MNYNKINLMIPTYKRQRNLQTVISSALNTASDSRVLAFSFCVNRKDQDTVDFINKFDFKGAVSCIVYEDTRQPNLALYWNKLYDETPFNCEDVLVTMIGDDMEFATKDWDIRILDKINQFDGNAIVYCAIDKPERNAGSTNLFLTRKIVKATKKPFMCEHFHADMIDVIWWCVGKATQTLHFLPDVVIKHNHMSALPKEQWDETHKRLVPLQLMYQNESYLKLAKSYATIAAANMIENGIGKWDLIC